VEPALEAAPVALVASGTLVPAPPPQACRNAITAGSEAKPAPMRRMRLREIDA
jgi:hypothetical protein